MDKNKLCVDISDSLGAPFGGFGTGYFVYGRHGFVNWNVEGNPEPEQTAEYPRGIRWNYYPDNPEEAPIALTLTCNGQMSVLQTRPCSFSEGKSCGDFAMYVYMPLGQVSMCADGNTRVEMTMYSSMKPHDVEQTSIPACVMEFTVHNDGDAAAEYTLGMAYNPAMFSTIKHGGFLQLSNRSGHVCFGFASGRDGKITLHVDAHSKATAVGVLSWYYPLFFLPGAAEDDIMFRYGNRSVYQENKGCYLRYYTSVYSSAKAVAKDALINFGSWKREIERWHDSYQVPTYCAHIWFGSVASLITATMYTVEGLYFEAEQPHGLVNTMDVSVYSNWIYLINWPEIEKKDLEMFISAVPRNGDTPGKVWHSLWADGAHYVEEAIYTIRIWRYVLWSGDREFLQKAFPTVRLAMEWIYRSEGLGSLINNVAGNQSYDAWKMPGIGAYINVQWIYALFAYNQMCRMMEEPCELCGQDLDSFLTDAVREYNEILWDEEGGYWHAYKPNEYSDQAPFGNAVFADQLFGHWVVALDSDSHNVLEEAKERRAIRKIYTHNRIIEPQQGYSCWSNGMMPIREETIRIASSQGLYEYEYCGYHALCCWVSTEMNMASMLGYFGMEEESLEAFASISEGMGQNVLAVGEYNRSVDEEVRAVMLPMEPGKDTPRFPPYPRYKSSWEYLIRLLGLEMDLDNIRLKPFRTISFSLDRVMLAGVAFTVRVEEGWMKCLVDGKESEPTILRSRKQVKMEFIR